MTTDTPKKTGEELKKLDRASFLKIVAVKSIVLFPHNVMPLTAGKDWLQKSLDKNIQPKETIGVLSYKPKVKKMNDPTQDLYQIGTEAKVLKIIKLPDGSSGAIIQGIRRFKVTSFDDLEQGSLSANVEFFPEFEETSLQDNIEYASLGKSVKQLVQRAIELSPQVPNEVGLFVENITDPVYLTDIVLPYLSLDFKKRQLILEIEDPLSRLQEVHTLLTREIEILELSKKFNHKVKSEISKQQRRFFLREKMKVMQKELGEIEGRKGGMVTEAAEFTEKIKKSKMPLDVKETAEREVDRLSLATQGSPEYNVSHSYLTALLEMPWGIFTQKKTIKLSSAEKILDTDHYGLKKVKKRILEFLAVSILKQSLKGPILLFVGPPGVGKTSLGKSVAKALNRKFTRIALGGVRDESEIRGHRRTYIGSMPGKIADALKKSGSMDPVILLDEVDKLANDGHSDPSSALLEVLDPEQNHQFTDHYLGVPIDLSKVFFICTANSLQSIPAPLRDRMEIVELSSYTLEEKKHIAQNHLLPQVMQEHGLSDLLDVKISPEVTKNLIERYTRESGVRSLKREFAAIMRYLAKDYVENHAGKISSVQSKSKVKLKSSAAQKTLKSKKLIKREVLDEDLHTILGQQFFLDKKKNASLPIGVATGLAWTPYGGDVLLVETVSNLDGTGKFSLTGQLGDVMKESVQTAYSYIRSHTQECGVVAAQFKKKDIHIHFPEGAVKKDGPSAGVAAFLGMVSQFSGKALQSDLAMTGEISLRGDVLAVGGIKEKVIAAHRFGIKNVLIPEDNKRDLDDIPSEILKELNIMPISTLKEALANAFHA